MSFTKLVAILFAELQRDPPPTFRKVGVGQVAAADREIYVRLAEATRSGLSLGPAGKLPLNVPLAAVLGNLAVMWLHAQAESGGLSIVIKKRPFCPAHRGGEEDKAEEVQAKQGQRTLRKLRSPERTIPRKPGSADVFLCLRKENACASALILARASRATASFRERGLGVIQVLGLLSTRTVPPRGLLIMMLARSYPVLLRLRSAIEVRRSG